MTTNRLDQIVQRQRTGRVRERLFIMAVALVTLVTAGTVAGASTGLSLTKPAAAATTADQAPSPSPFCCDARC